MALSGASRATADAFLDKQSRVALAQELVLRLQAEDLVREDKLRHWSLRVHHISGILKLAFELALALIFAALVAILGGTIWNAAHEDGLVIDVFKVPPDMAESGLTGDVVAASLLDQLTQMQSETDSSRAPSSYSSDWGDDIKVEIPNTGISIGEAYRFLTNWLGHQTHITGEIYHTDKGIAIVARVSGHSGIHFEGQANELAVLVKKAAESVYHQTQPYRYAIYVATTDTSPASLARQDALLADLALNGPDSEKPWAYLVWSYVSLGHGNLDEALYRARKAVALSPEFPDALLSLAGIEESAGHNEAALVATRRALGSLDGPGAKMIIPRAASVYRPGISASLAEDHGDYREALAQYAALETLPDFEGERWNASYMTKADLVLAHDVSGARRVTGIGTDQDMVRRMNNGLGWQLINILWPEYLLRTEQGDWGGARVDIEGIIATHRALPSAAVAYYPNQTLSWLALSLAHTGNAKQAHAVIDRTPPDCYDCLRARAQIDVVERNWNGAAYWFARAGAAAPSLPFADADWGAMLLARGNTDAAIAKLESARSRGPHFADPLEMWGEALMLKNRSDLALAKFEEANRYAPNWGRLHMKWGEALLWSGNKPGAQRQFAIATHLDLSAADKAALTRVRAVHG